MTRGAEKICFKCGVPQPLSTNFYRHPETVDGYLGKCISCTIEDNKLNYREFRNEHVIYEQEREQLPTRKANKLVYQARHRQTHPKRYKARNAVNNAIRDGRLERQPCEVCGKKAQAHHDDYSQPFQIRWLCFKHHRELAHSQTTST